jgi:hypothetical protein
MQYCVQNLGELRALAGKNNLSKFIEFWAPDHDSGRMSKEFEEHVKVVLAPLETTLQNTLTRLSDHIMLRALFSMKSSSRMRMIFRKLP